MTGLRRRAADRLPTVLRMALVAVLAVGCGSAAPSASTPAASSLATTPSPVASLTPVPGSSSAAAPSSSLPTTTSTEFGEIWDALPPSFPTLPGQQPATTAPGATSGSFAVDMDVAAATAAVRAALEAQGWRTVDVGSPLEDGTVVLTAAGSAVGCATEVRFTPTSGTVVMSVLYGAACPFA